MIEEHVIKLAELQTKCNKEEDAAMYISANIDEMIKSTKQDLIDLEDTRRALRQPQEISMAELDAEIADISAKIIDEWTGEKKTMVFDAGTLKFTQRGSLNIHDEAWLLSDILDRMSAEDIIKKKYLKGFNLTAVKKYMGVHELPIDVAEIEYKTTVKLEQKSGWTSAELEQGYKSG